jgi:formate-dependent nitrite reductase membrane component NrfD
MQLAIFHVFHPSTTLSSFYSVDDFLVTSFLVLCHLFFLRILKMENRWLTVRSCCFYYQVDGGSTPADPSTGSSTNNQMQLLNLHYEVKR